MKHSNQKVPLWTREFIDLSIGAGLQSTMDQMLVAAFPLFLMARGFSSSQVGMVVGVYTFCCIFMRALAGRLVDSLGRRIIALIGVVIFALPLLGFSLWSALWLITLCRGMQGFGVSTVTLCTSTMAADILPRARFAEGIGYFGLFKTMATAIGPAVGVALIQDGSSNLLFAVVAVVLAVSFVFIWRMNYEKTGTHPMEEPAAGAGAPAQAHRSFIWNFLEYTAMPSALLCFILNFGVAAVVNFAVPFAENMDLSLAGLFFTIEAATMFISRFLAGRVGESWGYYRTLFVGVLVVGASFLLLGLVQNTALFLFTGALYGVGCGFVWPMFNVLCLVRAPAHNRGRALTTYNLSSDAGVGVGALLCGVIIDHFGYRAIFFGSAAVAGLVLLLAWRWHRTLPSMYGESETTAPVGTRLAKK